MESTTLPPPITAPEQIHNCPECSHWLPDGTLACPDCQTLTYSRHLGELAAGAQMLEQQQKWVEARDRWQAALRWLPQDTRQSIGIQQHIAAIEARLKAEDDRKARWTKRLGPLAPIALFLFKAKSLLVLLKLKFLLSFFAFFAVYWAMFGWKFAAGFTGGILVHEMGHYLAARKRGMRAELPLFLPGFGAFVRWYNEGVPLEGIAAIALAGPLYGLGIACVYWLLGTYLHAPVFLVLANITAWLQMLNLIAVFGLDGAIAVHALTRLQRFLVAATCVIFFALTCQRNWTDFQAPANHIVFLFVAAAMLFRCFASDVPEEPNTTSLTTFLGIVIFCGMVIHVSAMQLVQLPGLATRFVIR